MHLLFFFFKQKTAYEMRISDWSSDVCSSDLKLRDDGKLRLDDLAEQYVPEMKGWTYPTTDSPRIRVRDLLQHVGGFVTDDPWGDRQQVLPQEDFTKLIAAGVPFSRVPQSQYEY